MKKIIIYGQRNVLGHENEYVFSQHELYEVPFDTFEVELPEKVEAYETVTGEKIIEGEGYIPVDIRDAFRCGEKPVLHLVDNQGNEKTVFVKYKKLNEEVGYNARYIGDF